MVAEQYKFAGAVLFLLLGICGLMILESRQVSLSRITRLNNTQKETLKEAEAAREIAEEVHIAGDQNALRVNEFTTKIDSVVAQQGALPWRFNSQTATLLSEIQSLGQLTSKFEPSGVLPQVGGWALNPSELLWLTERVEEKRPRLVVECGSGTSTFWIATALKELGKGKVIAIDHLEEFADKTQALIDAHGLNDFAEVRYAPLQDLELGGETYQWYGVDPSSLETIDLLVVDGPPTSVGKHARYPAIPQLGSQLADGAWILVDDTNRPDEQEMIEQWLTENKSLARDGEAGSTSEVLTFNL